jgi:hypothetical protein
MLGLRKTWSLAMTAALTSTLMLGDAAHARGGGHAGAIARPMTSTAPMATTPLPGVGLSTAHPGVGLQGGMLNQPAPGGAMRLPFATTITPPATVASPEIRQRPAGAISGTRGASAAAAAVLLNSTTGAIPPPPPEGGMPPSAIAAPTPELTPIAPLSSQLQTQFLTGGGVQPNLALSPGGGTLASPSQSAPSAPGGGGKSLADCMGFWDRQTHMSKAEWKAACVRTMDDYPTVLQ